MRLPIQLYLMRHAEAVSVGEQGVMRDADRMLTAKGRQQARDAGRLLSQLGIVPHAAASSPLARAVETAETVLAELKAAPAITRLSGLQPECTPEEMWHALGPVVAQSSSVLVIGHLNSLAVFAAWLIGAATPDAIHFRKASIAALTCTPHAKRPHATLEWHLSPALAKLARA